MVFEGLVINKTAYKERDLIVKLLLRNGSLGSFYVYGGQGGGKKQKPTIYELGSMLKVDTKDRRNSSVETSELLVVSEASRLWAPQNVRYNIQAFYLACLYFEIYQKIIHPTGATGEGMIDNDGLFAVLSNGIFYIEDALIKNEFEVATHLNLFLVKLLFHLGIMPDTDHCSYCQADLLDSPSVSFIPEQGQFACSQCVSAENEKGFLLRIKKSYQTKFQDYKELTHAHFSECDKLMNFFCHHFHLRTIELKTYSLLFSNPGQIQ